MDFKSYDDLEKEVSKLYDGKKYQKALELLNEALEKLPEMELEEHFFDLMSAKALVFGRLRLYEEHFETVKKIVERGFACPDYLLEKSPFKNERRYLDLENGNKVLLSELRKKSHLEYAVHLPENYDEDEKHPLFLALHGDGIDQNIEMFSKLWKPEPFLERNFVFVYVQSSQVSCHRGYGWLGDPAIARKDVKTCYDLVSKRYGIDDKAILIGGFSGGAMASIDITMENVLPLRGFIALCPEMKPDSFTRQNVGSAAQRGVRGVFLEGETEIPVPDEEEMSKLFGETNLPFKYYVNRGIGHAVPEDLSDKIREVLSFILD